MVAWLCLKLNCVLVIFSVVVLVNVECVCMHFRDDCDNCTPMQLNLLLIPHYDVFCRAFKCLIANSSFLTRFRTKVFMRSPYRFGAKEDHVLV